MREVTKGLRRKVWSWTKILSLNIGYFVAILILSRIMNNLELLGKKVSFFGGHKQCFLGKNCTITWYIMRILLSENCKFAIAHKNNAFVAKIVNTHLTKIFMAIFAPDERLPSSATLILSDTLYPILSQYSPLLTTQPGLWP